MRFTFSDTLKIILVNHINVIVIWLMVSYLVLYCNVENQGLVTVENKRLIVQVVICASEKSKKPWKFLKFRYNESISSEVHYELYLGWCSCVNFIK